MSNIDLVDIAKQLKGLTDRYINGEIKYIDYASQFDQTIKSTGMSKPEFEKKVNDWFDPNKTQNKSTVSLPPIKAKKMY